MSHIVTIRTQICDAVALEQACQRLRLPAPRQETVQLFSRSVAGHAVRLTDWRYPVVCDVAAGAIHYDNYGGRWGDQKRLDELLQSYAITKATLEARRQGYTVTELQLPDGAVKLQVFVGGAA